MLKGSKKMDLASQRGLLFENHIRSTLAQYCDTWTEHDMVVSRQTCTIRTMEIDLLWRVGSIVFIGEAKFQKFPANPNDIGHYYRELEKGAGQAKKRVATLETEKSRLKTLLHWKGAADELVLRALVICNHPTGSGLNVSGVPVIQFDMLENVFYNDAFGMTEAVEVEGNLLPRTALKYCRAPSEFSTFVEFYVENPPAVWLRKPAVKVAGIDSSKISTGETMRFEHRYVDLPLGLDGHRYFLDLQTRWSDLVTAHLNG